MMKKFPLIVGLAAVALAMGAYFIIDGKGGASAQMGAEGMPPPSVKVVTIAPRPITIFEELPGRTSAYRVAEIRPQVSGIVTERLFEEGALVEEGAQLYQIDDAPYKAAYDRAMADVQKAKANARSIDSRAARYQELIKIDAVSRQEVDDINASVASAKADIAVANAALATAKINLDYTKVYAPITGRIGKSMVTEGALVTAGQAQTLTSITQLDPIYVDMNQASKDMMRLRDKLSSDEPRKVELIIQETGASYDQMGTLQFSDVTVDETTGSVQLRALFPNPDEKLLPGLFVRARIHLDSYQGLLVPQRATTRGPDGNLIVWTVGEGNVANPAPIQVDGAYEDQWIVTGGLPEGSVVIVEGYQKIGPGTPVTPDTGAAATPPAGQPPEAAPAAAPTDENAGAEAGAEMSVEDMMGAPSLPPVEEPAQE